MQRREGAMAQLSRRAFNRAAAGLVGTGLVESLTALGPSTVLAAQAELARAGSITDVPGIRAGHFTDPRRPTGCTALLLDGGATAGVGEMARPDSRYVGD